MASVVPVAAPAAVVALVVVAAAVADAAPAAVVAHPVTDFCLAYGQMLPVLEMHISGGSQKTRRLAGFCFDVLMAGAARMPPLLVAAASGKNVFLDADHKVLG